MQERRSRSFKEDEYPYPQVQDFSMDMLDDDSIPDVDKSASFVAEGGGLDKLVNVAQKEAKESQ